MTQRIKADMMIQDLGFSLDKNGMQMRATVTDNQEAVAELAAAASGMLLEQNAENFVQFDMLTRPHEGMKAIRVTVQYAQKDGPVQKLKKYQDEIDFHRAGGIAQQPQSQASLSEQLDRLREAANKLGLYDASDFLSSVQDERSGSWVILKAGREGDREEG